MKSLTDQFTDWARTKPADEAYDYCDNHNCAFAQFLIANGLAEQPAVTADDWYDAAISFTGYREVPRCVSDALSAFSFNLPHGGRTFGALASRLSNPTGISTHASKGERP